MLQSYSIFCIIKVAMDGVLGGVKCPLCFFVFWVGCGVVASVCGGGQVWQGKYVDGCLLCKIRR